MEKEILYLNAADRNRLQVTRYGTSWGNGECRGDGVERRRERAAEAQERQDKRNNLNDAEQLKRLQDRGHGHCKEAQRLEAKIKASK